ncbi:MAG: PEP-CTERM sorting domain-containing protein [Phycisphaerae bacterium]|nr:PEP-CTERM sorting domain-containing protein [Phycisphaerae bacterium]
MKMKKIVMVMLVIGLMAMGAQAAFILSVTDNGSPATGLSSYTVTATATGDDTVVVTFTDVTITGNVHQVWANVAQGTYMTPTVDDLTGMVWDSDWDQYDTHFLIPEADYIPMYTGDGFVETNDTLDPAGLNLIKMTYEAQEGEGTYGMADAGDSAALKPAAQAASKDFMQVVLVHASAPVPVLLYVELVGDAMIPYQEEILIPEPATMLVLLGGALVGLIRRRR